MTEKRDRKIVADSGNTQMQRKCRGIDKRNTGEKIVTDSEITQIE